MNLATFVDVVIGVSVIHLSASLLVTIVDEYIAQTLRLRARQLKKDLAELIDDKDVVAFLRKNPALDSLFDSDAKNPRFFAAKPPATFVDPNVLAQQVVGALGTGAQALKAAGSGASAFVQKLAMHLDRTLVAMGEAYKRRVQWISFGVGVVIAVAFNLNTVTIVEHLYRDKEAREATVAVAVQLTQKTDSKAF